MLLQYNRNPKCECSKYPDIESVPISERASTTVFWMKGIIVENNVSHECECHRRWRLSEKYNTLAASFGLPSYFDLSKLKYLGTGDSYKKLKALPDIIKNNNLQNVLTFVSGEDGCQKTTSLAKLTYNLVTEGYAVIYVNFAELIEKIVAKDPVLDEIANVDYLIIDDCFVGETINFKTAYTAFYNLLLKRTKPTIISTKFSKDNLLTNKASVSYNYDMLKKVFAKVDKFKTYITFKDHVDKILEVGTENKVVDIWSL